MGIMTHKTSKTNLKAALIAAVAAASVVVGADAMAASTMGGGLTSNDGFGNLYTQLTGLMQGPLGKSISALFILVGIGAGVARQSIMPFAVGGGAGIGLNVAPNVIENSLFTASQVGTQIVTATSSAGLI